MANSQPGEPVSSVHPESLPKRPDKPFLPRPIHNGKNNLAVASFEVLLQRPSERLGDFMGVVAESPATPRPEDNAFIGKS
jgi:hypothetical protein